MNLLVMMVSAWFSFTAPAWLHSMDQAKKVSHEKHTPILINFSGSDWCGPCIKMEKQIFENPEFQEYAAQNLVLVNADFPRLKKNQLPKDQIALNEKLAEQYNKTGVFPLTLLVNEDGKVLKRWEGFPAKDAQAFLTQLKSIH
ncbi:thioredoxin fold domain-containing protein [Nibribacter ruber]|uniref:Thioredoxin fold domain-containing protein n=1 Tax=Nibribacter ruber TaxID=2698458 RepID=A0A6P1NUN7_9BACT|nr:thioredoxin family protein [Nibribacter ruber]QHL86044.1 thioredoxin fold domain-containing protein [Nibribacter ruber]